MIVITLTHPQQLEFLKHLFAQYLASGQMPPEELPLAADAFLHVSAAREISTDLGQAKLTDLSPNGLTLEFEEKTTGQTNV